MKALENTNSNHILKTADISRTITRPETKTIVDSFSYDFKEKQIYTIVGPSGSGKTSLLRLFNRLDEKSGGTLLFHNEPIENYKVTELRRRIALVFQIPHLFEGTVVSNLAYCCGDSFVNQLGFAEKYLSHVGLPANMAERDPNSLSVGQKQRVALARSLVQGPEILLLDEPTSALDPGASRTIEELIVKLNRELGLTIIAVTHNFEQAVRLGGISLFLVDGHLIESGPSQELFSNPGEELTGRFIKGELR